MESGELNPGPLGSRAQALVHESIHLPNRDSQSIVSNSGSQSPPWPSQIFCPVPCLVTVSEAPEGAGSQARLDFGLIIWVLCVRAFKRLPRLF